MIRAHKQKLNMQTITPFLWYDTQAEEAANLYVSIFKNSKILSTMPGPGGKPMGVTIELDGQRLITFNGGPHYKFNEAISLFVDVETQEEVDELWNKLTSDGGKEGQCGWLKDKFSLSWQIIPKKLTTLLSDPDRQKAGAVIQAMLKMKKIEIEKLENAVLNV